MAQQALQTLEILLRTCLLVLLYPKNNQILNTIMCISLDIFLIELLFQMDIFEDIVTKSSVIYVEVHQILRACLQVWNP